MRKITSIVSLAILLSAANVKADVIYELIETGTGDVRATLDFDSTVFGASPTSSWTAPTGVSLASLLEGGISGFMVDFGSGLEAAIGGDLPDALFLPFFSLDGSELDFGFYWDSVSSAIFASGSIGRATADNFAGSDTIASLDFSFAVNGDWVLQADGGSMPVPEPGTLALFVLGLFGLGLSRRKRTA